MRSMQECPLVLTQEIRFTSNSLHLRVNTDFTFTLSPSQFWLLKTANRYLQNNETRVQIVVVFKTIHYIKSSADFLNQNHNGTKTAG